MFAGVGELFNSSLALFGKAGVLAAGRGEKAGALKLYELTLRRAKLEMLGGTAELFRHPFCWAAFVMYGE
jgi:hypothetical protein